MRKVVIITGMQAAGKTTIGPLLAARLAPPAAAFDGDAFYRKVEIGNVNMSAERSPEAVRQVGLRYAAAALVAQHYSTAGFDFVYTDIILGADITQWMDSITGAARHLVVLNPSAEAIAERELSRGKGNSYRDWQKPGMSLIEAIMSMQESLKETPRRGLWLDSTGLTAAQTVEAILANDMKESLY
jgi:Chloramphenicol phosphotransferase-like protein